MVTEVRTIVLENQQSIVARAGYTRKSIAVQDVTQSPTFLPHPLLPDTKSELAVPLVARGQLLGVLDVQSDVVDYFASEVVAVIELMAGQIATALSNASLYEVADRSSRHERALGRIDRHIQSATDMDEILQVAVRELGKALRAPHTAIELRLSTSENNQAVQEPELNGDSQ
jgi:GAF domain-containing protein